MLAGSGRHHLLGAFLPGLFQRQSDQGFGGQKHVPMLLEQIDILAGVHMRPVDLLLVDGSVGQCDEYNGLNNHEGLLYKSSLYAAPSRSSDEGEKCADFPF